MQTNLRKVLEEIVTSISVEGLASMIDNTKLTPTISYDEVVRLVEETSKFRFKCAMLPPTYIPRVFDIAKTLNVPLCTVIGFPSGYQPAEAKRSEILYVSEYVEEIDIVAPVWAAKTGDYAYVVEELAMLVDVAKENGIKTVKIIVMAPLVNDSVLNQLVEASYKAGADFVKTSTGVYSKGGDPRTVLRLSEIAQNYNLKVKAAGGIRTAIDAILAIASGAQRIGTSSARNIIEDYKTLMGE